MTDVIDLPVKDRFHLPEGVTYLDGNSLGVLPRGAAARAAQVIEHDWGNELIRAWNSCDWMDLPRRVGDRVAGLIGAPAGTVTMGDTLSVKVFQALSAAVEMRPDRRVILSDAGNFPSDLYMADGLVRHLGRDHSVVTPAPEDVLAAIDESVAVVMLTEVDYRTGRRHDVGAITEAAHAAGAVMIWDLAHSAGALPVDVAGCNCEFAVGCTYKYLNGGPGRPAFIYVRPDLADSIDPVLQGWLGHAAPFEMARDYRPAPGVERMRVGTPPVLQLAVLEAALDAWEGVSLESLRAASVALSERFITEVEARCPSLTLASPRDAGARGSQVSFAHPEGFAIMQALIARGVIGDFRAPDILRFGFTPLYLDEGDVVRAAEVLEEIMVTEAWRAAEYQVRGRVT
ncbi:kynureninase [Roseivivax sp. THAF197b]|uniref:kynureninase n=1 Tax=Roseivivax sp. THAF197b TaxID=2588299 RepID=UPI0012697311|nr:kynureninase [Roseivivax sp. THAF197b]QFS84147.1 Kynureninase [Roseivivax sp. THAF197b]